MKKLYSIIILSIIALGNAIYLTIGAINFKGNNGEVGKLFCDINDSFNCSSLFGMDFSRIFGVPFPGIAMAVYPIIAIIALLGILQVIKKCFLIIFIIGLCGMCFNGYIIYNEFLVGIFCPSCLACSIIIISITILSFIGIMDKNKKES